MTPHLCLCCETEFLGLPPFCADCEPTLAHHVVSMRTAPGEALAVCPCGWADRAPWTAEGRAALNRAVEAHWREVVGR